MIKYLLFLLIVLCGVHNGNAWAGDYSVGATWDSTMKTPRPIWGIRGYIILEPNSIYQAGKGLIYHTHTNGSKYGSEVIVKYSNDAPAGHLKLILWRWYPLNHDFINLIPGGDSRRGTAAAELLFNISGGTGTIYSDFQKYTEDLSFGTETKKVMYFDNLSIFTPMSVGTTTGYWKEVTNIWNFQTGRMEMKWAHQWKGTLAENYSALSNEGYWAGAIETTDTGTSTWASSSNSAGNFLMDFIGPTGEWIPMDDRVANLRVLDNGAPGGYTGMSVYHPASPSPGDWLAKVP